MAFYMTLKDENVLMIHIFFKLTFDLIKRTHYFRIQQHNSPKIATGLICHHKQVIFIQ